MIYHNKKNINNIINDDNIGNNNINTNNRTEKMAIKELIVKLENEYNMQYYDIKKLLKFCLKADDRYLIIHNNDKIDKGKQKQIFLYANEIKNGVPIQYVINEQDFMGQAFYVNENVLIPQPDTEVVVQCAINKIKELMNTNNKNEPIKHNQIKVLDLCTGSGAIGISIKKYFGEYVNVTLSDISNKALDVAKINAKRILDNQNVTEQNSSKKIIKNNIFSIESNVNFFLFFMFQNVKGNFDIIVSNPLYIKSKLIDELDKDVKNEPHIALDGGSDGLKFYKIIKSEINHFLNKNGYLILEIGYDQKEDVQKMFENSKCIKDYAGNDRVIILRR